MHKPPVIVLDEPTAGVDVELRQSLWAFIRKLNRDGHTIILTTHYLEEAEALCGRIAMLKAGRVVALDTKQNLLSRFAGLTVRLVAARVPAAWQPRVLRQDGGVFFIGLDRYADLESLLAALRVEGIAIDELALQETDLEQVFLQIMARERRAGGHGGGPAMTRFAGAGWLTLLYKELLRFWKVSFQTILAPVLTALLYLLIFSHVLESHVSVFDGEVSLHGVPRSRARHDVGAAERLRQQLVVADPVEDHRQSDLHPAAAAVAARALRRLRARRDGARPRRRRSACSP